MHRHTSACPFLSLHNATFRLGDRLVFENSSWAFGRNEHWAVLGGNSSGKSLFADALCGVLPLVGGELTYHFRPPPGCTPEEALGHVSFEDRRLEVHETVVQSRWSSIEQEAAERVLDFLSYERVLDINPFEVVPGRAAARRQFARRLAKAAKLLRLSPLLDRPLLSLSNGERQRVQIARALCRPLRLLVLDEPFAGLDAQAREHFRHVLEELMETPLRVLLLTTRAEDLPRHITHALWLKDCRIVAAGPWRANPARPTSLKSARHSASHGAAIVFSSPAARQKARRSNTDELVRLNNVTVRYGQTTILKNLNWIVRRGESWALVGPNGSGKTTLLSLILGDNPQVYRNDVSLFGRRRGRGESMWEIKRRIGSVSPELQVHFAPAATCFEVVGSGFFDTIGLFEPLSACQRKAVRGWLRRFDLEEYARAPLFSLSAGLQRMVLLARALVKQPELLLLDEPCQGLDAAHRQLFIRTVNKLLRRGGVTAIYVSHRPDEIPSAITRVLRLEKGRQV